MRSQLLIKKKFCQVKNENNIFTEKNQLTFYNKTWFSTRVNFGIQKIVYFVKENVRKRDNYKFYLAKCNTIVTGHRSQIN